MALDSTKDQPKMPRTRIPKIPSRAGFLRRAVPPNFSEGDFDPPQNWIRSHGKSIPSGPTFMFDEDGNDVRLDDVECGRIYFTMCWEFNAVPSCPALLAVWLMINRTRRNALRAAERIAARCEQKPSCQAQITLQARNWGCKRFAGGVRFEAYSGHCFRVVCTES